MACSLLQLILDMINQRIYPVNDTSIGDLRLGCLVSVLSWFNLPAGRFQRFQASKTKKK